MLARLILCHNGGTMQKGVEDVGFVEIIILREPSTARTRQAKGQMAYYEGVDEVRRGKVKLGFDEGVINRRLPLLFRVQ